MGATQLSNEGHVTTVLEATKSTETCSASTLRLLQALLGLSEGDASRSGPSKPPERTNPRKLKPEIATKTTKKANAGNLKVLQCEESTIQCLPESRRLALATRVFNESLKALGDSEKRRHIKSQESCVGYRSPLKETQGRARATPRSNSQASSPCAQKDCSKPQQPQKGARDSTTFQSVQGLRATAECSRTALNALWELRQGNSAGDDESIQLAHGSLALVSRLHALEFVSSATREVLALRRRLLDNLCKDEDTLAKKSNHKNSHESSLIECLNLLPCSDSTKIFRLIVTFQLETLRLVSLNKTSTAQQDLLARLDLENQASPVNFILRGVERGYVTPRKGALDLHTLSQCLSSITMGQGDEGSVPLSTSPPVEAGFRLQCLSLRIRCRSAKLAGHQLNVDSEVWTPFRRLVQGLCRRVEQVTKQLFNLVKSCAQEIVDLLPETRDSCLNQAAEKESSQVLAMTLLDMAEAVKTTRDIVASLHSLRDGNIIPKGLSLTIYHCKLGCAMLSDGTINAKVLFPILENAIEFLDKPLRGSTVQLEELLLQVSRLRKVAATQIAAGVESYKHSHLRQETDIKLWELCARVIFAVLHVFSRYTSVKSLLPSASKSPPSGPSSGQCLIRCAQQSVRSALATVQASVSHDFVDWVHCVSALANCLSLSSSLSMTRERRKSDQRCDGGEPTMAIQVSNLHWLQYLRKRDCKIATADLAMILKRSISVLEPSDLSEKRLGCLTIKCERLVGLYIELKHYKKARQVLTFTLDILREEGALTDVAPKLFSLSGGHNCVDVNSPEGMTGRLLTTYAKLVLKCHSTATPAAFFDNPELKGKDRAAILEKQFASLSERPVPAAFLDHLKQTARTILLYYLAETHSPNLLRFSHKILLFCFSNGLEPDKILPREALEICRGQDVNEPSSDEEMISGSYQCLYTSLRLRWEFQYGVPSTELLKEFVSCHTRVLSSVDNSSSTPLTISDSTRLIAMVQSVTDFADMKGLIPLKLDGLLMMRRLLEPSSTEEASTLTSCMAQIGIEYTRMGHMNRAAEAFLSGRSLLKQNKSKTLLALQLHLAYAEYLTAIGSYDKAREELISAQWQFEADFAAEDGYESSVSRTAQQKYLAQVAQLSAELAFETRDLEYAILYAKKSVKLGLRQWAGLEKLMGYRQTPPKKGEACPTERITDEISNLSLSAGKSPVRSSWKGSLLWSYVRPYFDSLMRLSRLSAHCGSLQDAVYYAEQAKNVAEKMTADGLLNEASCLLAAHFAQCGNLSAGQKLIDSCVQSTGSTWKGASAFDSLMDLIGALNATGELKAALKVVRDAELSIDDLLAKQRSWTSNQPNSEPGPTKTSTDMIRSKRAKPNAKRRPKTYHPAERLRDEALLANNKDDPDTTIPCWIQKRQVVLDVLKCILYVQAETYEEAQNTLRSLKSFDLSPAYRTWVSVVEAELMVTDSRIFLESNPMYSVLSESTIVFPSKRGEDPAQAYPTKAPRSSAKRGQGAPSVAVIQKGAKQEKLPDAGDSDAVKLLEEARKLLLNTTSSLLSASSFSAANEHSSLLTSVQVLCSVLVSEKGLGSSQALSHRDEPRALRWSREALSTNADVALSDKNGLLTWSEPRKIDESTLGVFDLDLDRTSFPELLLDILPSTWTVISIDLSADKTEFYLSKLQQKCQPFSVRLPLLRSNSEELDEGGLDFDSARKEMLDIITYANLTAHDNKMPSGKQGKKEWWTAREELDERLKGLLHEIENTWFGGFRGLFSEYRPAQDLLSRFSDSLCRALNRHLPSRQRVSHKPDTKLHLHPYILELFVSLDGLEEDDLGDAVTDLLYLIIDILQFEGEVNAYDEIDFDAILIEVLDALRSYHHDLTKKSERRHTILVLDKALHSFPWESMDCLRHQSVSRMPSLSSIHTFLSNSEQNRINAQNGAYILNPSSDLNSTQEALLNPFQSQLAQYESIVNRAPSEEEFESFLRDRELCLYFGHGSGAQYIRGRTIKRLDRCAVTFLMGCSSGKLVDCGQFEPYGVPFNYLQAGSPAVVGTLWDVTDKDIDRFAMETFVRWKLLRKEEVLEPKSVKGPRAVRAKGKNKGRKMLETPSRGNTAFGSIVEEDGDRDVALGAAVALARDACVLPYLNGAAPVIYGVPVFLDR